MKTLTSAEAEALRGGVGPAVTIAPVISVNTNLAGALQMNSGVSTIAGLIGGSASIGSLQANGLYFSLANG
jgi:hypothetical protein